MKWDANLIQLIITQGLPLAQALWKKVSSGKEVTQEDWNELDAIAAQTPMSHLQAVAGKLGLSMDDPKVKQLAELIK